MNPATANGSRANANSHQEAAYGRRCLNVRNAHAETTMVADISEDDSSTARLIADILRKSVAVKFLGICVVVGGAMWVSTLVIAADCLSSGCDNEAASASVGSCLGSYTDCGSFGNRNSCEAAWRLYIRGVPISTLPDIKSVRQDFPTSCKTNRDGFNCNEPASPCWEKAVCRWENRRCFAAITFGPAVSEKKRTTCTCREDGAG